VARVWPDLAWPSWSQIGLGVALFTVLAAASALLTGWIVVRMPADYFVGRHPPPLFDGRHPVVRLAARGVKNLIGLALLVAGVLMLFTPGQGVLTILLGLMFLDLPGKRGLERRLVRRPAVLAAINALRRRYGRPGLVFDDRPAQHDGHNVPPRPTPEAGRASSR
jgi:hypothetical protein